jgi:hypothetical protein
MDVSRNANVRETRRSVKAGIPPWAIKFMIKDDVLYHRDGRSHPYWRPVLPRILECRVISYVHALLGHQGTASEETSSAASKQGNGRICMGLSVPASLQPLKYGWKRELVYRTNGSGSKNRGDILLHARR